MKLYSIHYDYLRCVSVHMSSPPFFFSPLFITYSVLHYIFSRHRPPQISRLHRPSHAAHIHVPYTCHETQNDCSMCLFMFSNCCGNYVFDEGYGKISSKKCLFQSVILFLLFYRNDTSDNSRTRLRSNEHRLCVSHVTIDLQLFVVLFLIHTKWMMSKSTFVDDISSCPP